LAITPDGRTNHGAETTASCSHRQGEAEDQCRVARRQATQVGHQVRVEGWHQGEATGE
jgi:hypothetical protein